MAKKEIPTKDPGKDAPKEASPPAEKKKAPAEKEKKAAPGKPPAAPPAASPTPPPAKSGMGFFGVLFLVLILLGGAGAGVWFKLYPMEKKRLAKADKALEMRLQKSLQKIATQVTAESRAAQNKVDAVSTGLDQKLSGMRTALTTQESRITALENEPNPFELEKQAVNGLLLKMQTTNDVAAQTRSELANQLADLKTDNEVARQNLAGLGRNIARLQSVGASIHKGMIKTQVEQLLIMADGQIRLANDYTSAGTLLDAALAQLESATALGVKADGVAAEISASLAVMRNPKNAPLALLTGHVKALKQAALESSLPAAPIPEEVLKVDAAAAETLAPSNPQWREYWNKATAWAARQFNQRVTVRHDPSKSGKPVIKQVPTEISLILDQLELVRLSLKNGDRKTALSLTGRLGGVLPKDRGPEAPQTRFNKRLVQLKADLEAFTPVKLDLPALKNGLEEAFS